MILGYARVSTIDQNDAQMRALEQAGAERLFVDHASGARRERPELNRLFEQLRSGDIVIVWKLDRLSRSLITLHELVKDIQAVGAKLRSITEAIDSTGAAGDMILNILAVVAQYERDLIRERTMAGLGNARAQGCIGGRPSKLTEAQQTEVFEAVKSGRKTAAAMARIFKVHPSAISRLLSKGK